MNCNCIKEIEDKMKGREYDGRTIEKAEIQEISFIFKKDGSGMTTSTHSTIELQVGLKRPKKTNILHSYCPFCGKKRNKES